MPVSMPEQAESTIDARPVLNPGSDDSGTEDRCADSEPFVDEYDPEFGRDYVPDVIHISEERQKELQENFKRYVADLIAEIGEPTEEERVRALAFWRPIMEHLGRPMDP